MILFIFEGKDDEPRLYKTLKEIFHFELNEEEILHYYCSNIFSLYDTIKEYGIFDGSVNLINVLKEEAAKHKEVKSDLNRIKYSYEVSEIFMFFDYDIRKQDEKNKLTIEQQNAKIMELFNYFENESLDSERNGIKLYINYPMIESYRFFKKELPDEDFKNYTFDLMSEKSFKKIVGEESYYKNLKLLCFDLRKSGELKIPEEKVLTEKIKQNWLLLKDLRLPNFRDYAVEFDKHGNIMAEDMIEVGKYLRDVIELNHNEANFRIFAPDETKSNRLGYIFEKTNRKWNAKIKVDDESLSREGAVVDSILSEHVCEGLLEGYLLTGRHGLFNSYEAFIRIVDSMVSQHAKWLKVANEIPWRRPISSLNLVLSSHIWQQDHNGFTLVTKKADTVRIYLPPDANCLLSCVDHCLRSKNYINVIVASKHPRFQWLSMNEAIAHCSQGISIFKWASNDEDNNPDIVMASSGDTPTLETLAAVSILRKHFPKLKIRVVNVVDLMKLQSNLEHPHGLSDEDYDAIFTVDKPIIFAFHGYANLIHELTHNRHNKNIHVRGYKEEGTITTPFDMRVQNEIDRFNLVILALKHIPKLKDKSSELIQECKNKLIEHSEYIKEYGDDLPEVKNFVWEDINKD